jgi:hypothetical protein
MRVVTGIVALLAAVVLVAGCSKASLLNAFVSPEDEGLAKHYIEALKSGHIDEIEKNLDPSVTSATPDIQQALTHLAGLIPAEDPLSVKLVGSNTISVSNSDGTLHKSSITFEYQYPDRWLLINVVTQKRGDISTILGLNVQPLSDSLENINHFSLSNKSALQYGVLVAAVVAPLLTIYALVLCVRTKIARRKWLWIVFILLGVGSFSVNWTTGAWGFQPLYVQLFSSGMKAATYGPWIVSVALPLGAIIFLLRRKSLAAPRITD